MKFFWGTFPPFAFSFYQIYNAPYFYSENWTGKPVSDKRKTIMKRILSALAVAALCFNVNALNSEKVLNKCVSSDNNIFEKNASAQSDLYVVVIDLDQEGYITSPEFMSLEEYAKLVEKDSGQALGNEYPCAAFALVRYDREEDRLFPTDPAREIKELKKIDPDWYDKEVRFINILQKTGKLFLKGFEVSMLWVCWTGSYVLIPGSQRLYEHGSNLVEWLRENYFKQVVQENGMLEVYQDESEQ